MADTTQQAAAVSLHYAIERQLKHATHFRFDGDGQFGGWTECRADEKGAVPMFTKHDIESIVAALSLPVEAPSEGVRKDAERYRYLVGACGFSIAEDLFGITTGKNVIAQLDAAIDENIEAHRQWKK